MNKTENKLVPELRFPEFMNDGDWESKSFEKLLEIGNGRDYKHLDQGDIPVYGSGGYMLSVNNYLYNGESVCIGRKGTIDKPMFLTGKFWTVDTLFYTHSFNNCQPKFIYYIFQNIDWLKHNEAGGVPSLSKANIYKIKTAIPELKEQKKIADCLSSLDEAISVHSDKLEALKNHKKGLLQNLFPQEGETVPKYRFPEFKNDGDWEENKLENYINLFSGIALKSEEITDNESGVPILRGINITEGYIRHSKDIDKYFLGKIENLERFFVKENDIVIGMDGSKVGKNVALIRKEDENSILIQRVARIRTNKNSDTHFIYQYFKSDKFRNYVDTVNTSSGIPHISAQQIKDFKAGIPPKLKEQQKIADCLSEVDNLITAQADKIEQLKAHKKGLMQQLFPQLKA
ncbi:restriction endonuclease subunit S [Elizabethkingia anophelis]|uniref:restriction endonuclease subunit S n=1 Tax=Elizabethkingia anophelis TaxID=1117645 RepID=UPI00200E3C7B|nr:restriction endonuclease subunit S [Elizabethkingia anophelis]MCL1032741.1 restriction endonuclease subunit S [Elizabethkingia anophelis]